MVKRSARYIPGVCNIGRDEIRVRALTGLVGLFITSILLIILIVVRAAPVIRVLVYIPAFISALGFLQAYFHFCAYFGLKSLFNFEKAGTTPEAIWDDDMRRLDRRRAWTIIAYAAVIAAGVTVVTFIVPF
jgi:hypothetical protein